MKILATGGAGFIGTHLCRLLVGQGHEVRVLDLVRPQTPIANVEYIQGDIRDYNAVQAVIEDVDAVFHLAATVSVPLCQENPLESYGVNVVGTCQVLEAIRNEMTRTKKEIRFVFSGSSVVYGDSGEKNEAISEIVPLKTPLSFYGAQKLASEHAIKLYRQTYGIPSIVFRYFNVFGPGQDPSSPYSGVISIFAGRLKQGQTFYLNGSGEQTRDFVSVHDVARANAMALKVPTEQADALPINIGSGTSVSIKELATAMMAVAGREVRTEKRPPREGDIPYSMANISRARQILKWEPKVSLIEGLSELRE